MAGMPSRESHWQAGSVQAHNRHTLPVTRHCATGPGQGRFEPVRVCVCGCQLIWEQVGFNLFLMEAKPTPQDQACSVRLLLWRPREPWGAVPGQPHKLGPLSEPCAQRRQSRELVVLRLSPPPSCRTMSSPAGISCSHSSAEPVGLVQGAAQEPSGRGPEGSQRTS